MARYYFGDENPIGRHLVVHYSFGDAEYEIQGVVADSRNNAIRTAQERRCFLPFFDAISKPTWGVFEVRFVGDAPEITSEIRRLVREADGNLDPLVFHTIHELIDQRLTGDKLTARLSSLHPAPRANGPKRSSIASMLATDDNPGLAWSSLSRKPVRHNHSRRNPRPRNRFPTEAGKQREVGRDGASCFRQEK